MKSTKIDADIQRGLDQLLKKYPKVRNIVQSIADAGGRVLLVGGAVRDLLLGIPTKDLDIEIHGLDPKQLEAVLKKFGHVDLVGKAFGVYRIHGIDIDWSLPRKDTAGRKPTVVIDPHMKIKEAFARRDLTINAMAIDLITNELLDPFNGQKDLKEKKLRAPDAAFFVQDPLRFFRVMQFISRFEMEPDKQLNELCKKMDVSAVSKERIETEFEKLLLRSERPSLGLRWLKKIGRLHDTLPELYETIGIEQDPRWHPEGDVFEHTMQAVDAAAHLPYKNKDKLILMYAALCHDLGKVSTTTHEKDGSIRSLGHAQASEKLAKNMLARITRKKDIIAAVKKLVRYHMMPIQFLKGKAKAPAYKRLAHKLSPLNLQMLAALFLVDRQGRNAKKYEPLKTTDAEVKTFIAHAQKAKVARKREEPVLQGRDLLDVIKPGPQLGKLVARAYEIQIEDGIKDKQELKKRVLQNIKKK